VRANLTATALPKDHRTSWRFLDVKP